MAFEPRGSYLAIPAALVATALIWSSGSIMSARTRTIGADRVVSFEELPEPESELCGMPGMETASLPAAIHSIETLPKPEGSNLVCAVPPKASGAEALVAAAPQQVTAGVGTAYQARTRAGQINRKPVRYIKDPYPAFSSIAVNAENDMVMVTDENLFRVVEYSRRDNTPAGTSITAPRRVIGGPDTKTEMMCGAYIDPQTLDVYVTNNDTQNWLPVFSREARGNATPDRMLMTPHRTWGIAADEQRQELYLTVQDPPLVIVYRKQAANNEAPLRILEGDATGLADPHGLALDMTRNLMIITNHGHRRFYGGSGAAISTMRQPWEEWISRLDDLNSPPRERLLGVGQFDMPSITIHQRGVSGNTAPLRVIKGPKTQLNWPSHVAVHEGRGEIFVANDADDSVLVFRESDSGDVAPIRVIKGARAWVKNPTGLTVDEKNNELWVASMGNYTIAVFPIAANGNVAPLRTIHGGPSDHVALMIGNPGAVGYDRKRQEILVPNWVAHPQIAAFARLADGGQAPTRRIFGQASKLSRTMHDIRYNEVNDEILVPNPFSNAILVFKGGANGQEAPIRIIQGAKTVLDGPDRLDIDTTHREIFVPDGGRVLVYPLDGNGDVAPLRVIQGPDTQIAGQSLAVDPLNNLIAVTGRDRSILIFDRTANGNAKPLRVIKGDVTQIDRINQMAIYPQGKLLVVAMPGRQGDVEPPRVFVGMWSLDDNGNVPPKWTINGDQSTLRKPFAVALNPDQKELYVTDMRLNGVMTFSVPEIFEPVAK